MTDNSWKIGERVLNMVDNIVKVVYAIILSIFLLSVIAPKKSQNRFWRIIHKFRAGLDWASGWIFKIYLILLIIYVAWMGMHGWIAAHVF